ncbi:MAG: fibronectin type III domain-containing protein [Phycisphaerales bacterium]|nr:MAG: fibronectin type III domain-containing protein [Phycisphaerales bacterium]
MRHLYLLVGLVVATGFGIVSQALAQQASFRALGDLPGGDYVSRAYDVSADGLVVVGVSSSANGGEAFRWTIGTGMVGLGDLPGGSYSSWARGVSGDGSVVVGVGKSASGTEAMRWRSSGGMVGLGDLPGGAFASLADGVSWDGAIVVGFGQSSSGTEAFRWTSGGGMTGLGELPGGDFFSWARGVSGDGSTVVGVSASESGDEAFRWTSGDGIVGLGDLPGGSFSSSAYGASENGSVIVGHAISSDGREAFRWEDGVMVGLDDLPGGGFGSWALDVSADGSVVVGLGETALGTEVFIWNAADGMRDFRELLIAEGVTGLTGWTLGKPQGISADGLVIAGFGTNPDGNQEAWIARIAPETPPDVVDVSAAERPDASGLVDMYYELQDVNADDCLITLEISNDAGTTWTVPTASATGDIGSGILPAEDLHIVWDPGVDAPGQTGCSFGARVTADDGTSGTGTGESATFCLDDAPPEPPGVDEVRVGQLVITGDVIDEMDDEIWQITGNVMVNDILRVTGTVTANTATSMVSGDGEIWIDNLPGLGSVQLYDGEWQFDGRTAATTAINTFLSQLELAGMTVKCTAIDLVGTTVRVQGYIELPPTVGGGRIDISGSHFLQMSSSNGLEFDFTIEKEIDLDVGGFAFSAQDSAVYLSNAGGQEVCEIYGVYELSDFLGGVRVNLDPDEGNYFSVTKEGDEVQVDIVGSIAIGEIIITPGIYGKDLFLDMDTTVNSYYAAGTVGFPAGATHVEAAGELGIDHGYFDAASLTASFDPAIGILPAPPQPAVVYLTSVGAGIYNLSPLSEKEVVLQLTGGLQGGPEFFGYSLVMLDLTGTVDLSGSIRGDAVLKLGNNAEDDPIITGNATVIVDLNNGMYLALSVTKDYEGSDFLFLGGQALLDLNNHFVGGLTGRIVVPADVPVVGALAGGQELTTRAYAQASDDGDDTNDYLAAGFTVIVDMPFVGPVEMKPVIEISLATNEIDWMGSWDRIKEVTFPGTGLRGGTPPEDFDVDSGLAYVIFRATWETGVTDLELITPGDQLITPDNVDSNAFNHVEYFTNTSTYGNEAFYVVKEPQGGTWQLLLSEGEGIGEYTLEHLQGPPALNIELIEPSMDTSGVAVTITWTDADTNGDANVALYYDANHRDADGTLIVGDIPAEDSANSYLWDTGGVPVGDYYVYAVLADGKGSPSISYSLGRVCVRNESAPSPPTDLAVAPTNSNGELAVSWTASAAAEVDHYNVYYTADAAGEGMPHVRGAGDRTRVVLKEMIPGATYRIAVASVDDANTSGPVSEPVVLTLEHEANHLPVFTGRIASQATVGRVYQSQVRATDIDGHTIGYGLSGEPVGMVVSGDGVIEWTPSGDQIGNHTFDVLLDDAYGGTNGMRFGIHVVHAGGENRPPEILSQAPVLAEPLAQYVYPVRADDPDEGDTVFYDLLDAPSGAMVNTSGLVEYAVPDGSGRYDFCVRARDGEGLYDLQRFSIQADVDAPDVNSSGWGILTATAVDTIRVEALSASDATGLNEYQLEDDGLPIAWQRVPAWTVGGLAPNTPRSFRVRARDASPYPNESIWSAAATVHTLAETPPAPTLVSAEAAALNISVSAGLNPPSTQLAIRNTSEQEWLALDGTGSAVEVWNDAATWGTVHVQGLAVDTTYHLQVKARNEDGIDTALSALLAATTLAPPAGALIDVSSNALYENPVGSTASQIVLSASFDNDPHANNSYTYTWLAPEHATTGKTMVLVSGGGPDDSTAIHAAPETPAGDLTPYEIQCVVTGYDVGNYVMGTVEVTVLKLGDADRDGDVDLADYKQFAQCMTGPDGGPAADGCAAFHFDPNEDVDLADFAAFQNAFTGP